MLLKTNAARAASIIILKGEMKVVKHIVMWNLTDKDKVAENGAIMKQKLEALVGVVPGCCAPR